MKKLVAIASMALCFTSVADEGIFALEGKYNLETKSANKRFAIGELKQDGPELYRVTISPDRKGAPRILRIRNLEEGVTLKLPLKADSCVSDDMTGERVGFGYAVYETENCVTSLEGNTVNSKMVVTQEYEMVGISSEVINKAYDFITGRKTYRKENHSTVVNEIDFKVEFYKDQIHVTVSDSYDEELGGATVLKLTKNESSKSIRK